MLVLTRRLGEEIKIGGDIVVSVQRIAGSRVKLAIHAPRQVEIYRGELAQSKEADPPAQEEPQLPLFAPKQQTLLPLAGDQLRERYCVRRGGLRGFMRRRLQPETVEPTA